MLLQETVLQHLMRHLHGDVIHYLPGAVQEEQLCRKGPIPLQAFLVQFAERSPQACKILSFFLWAEGLVEGSRYLLK